MTRAAHRWTGTGPKWRCSTWSVRLGISFQCFSLPDAGAGLQSDDNRFAAGISVSDFTVASATLLPRYVLSLCSGGAASGDLWAFSMQRNHVISQGWLLDGAPVARAIREGAKARFDGFLIFSWGQYRQVLSIVLRLYLVSCTSSVESCNVLQWQEVEIAVLTPGQLTAVTVFWHSESLCFLASNFLACRRGTHPPEEKSAGFRSLELSFWVTTCDYCKCPGLEQQNPKKLLIIIFGFRGWMHGQPRLRAQWPISQEKLQWLFADSGLPDFARLSILFPKGSRENANAKSSPKLPKLSKSYPNLQPVKNMKPLEMLELSHFFKTDVDGSMGRWIDGICYCMLLPSLLQCWKTSTRGLSGNLLL